MDPWTILRSLPAVADPPGAEYAVLVPLYIDDDDHMRVILTRRPDTMPTHPGDIVFPGGHREAGEDPIDTAKREAFEEVGLPPEAVVEIFGGLEPVTTRDRKRPIVPVVARIARPKELVADPREVDVIIEPTIDELLDDSRWKRRPWFGFSLWFFEFEEGMLWGATAAMMRELLGHLNGDQGK